MIDVKNAKYVKSSTSKLSFILSENYDVEGKIENILKLMKHQKNEELYAHAFGLYKMGIVDSQSLYKPRTYRSFVSETPLEIVNEIDQDYVDQVRLNLFKDNRFSTKTINEYVKNILTKRHQVKASELDFQNNEDLTRLILIQLYAHHEHMCYQTVSANEVVRSNNIEYNDFWIMKRGEHSAK
jgi:hypothetical protein